MNSAFSRDPVDSAPVVQISVMVKENDLKQHRLVKVKCNPTLVVHSMDIVDVNVIKIVSTQRLPRNDIKNILAAEGSQHVWLQVGQQKSKLTLLNYPV